MDLKLEKALEEIIEDKTFSLAAVEAIKAMRTDNTVLEKRNQSLDDELKRAKDNETELRERNDELIGQVGDWQAREGALEVREAEITKLEKSAAVAVGKSEMLGLCFDGIFKNTIFRESFNKSVPGGVDQYGCQQTGHESGDVTKTTGAE